MLPYLCDQPILPFQALVSDYPQMNKAYYGSHVQNWSALLVAEEVAGLEEEVVADWLAVVGAVVAVAGESVLRVQLVCL